MKAGFIYKMEELLDNEIFPVTTWMFEHEGKGLALVGISIEGELAVLHFNAMPKEVYPIDLHFRLEAADCTDYTPISIVIDGVRYDDYSFYAVPAECDGRDCVMRIYFEA